MGFFDKIVNTLRGNDDDDDYIDEDYFDDPPEEEEEDRRGRRNQQPKSQPMGGIFQRKVIDGTPQGAKIITIKPNSIDDSREICDHLLDGTIVLLNMKGVNTAMAQRVIDFVLGAVYAIEGEVQQANDDFFICTPSNVEVSGQNIGDFSGTGSQGIPQGQSNQSNGFYFNV